MFLYLTTAQSRRFISFAISMLSCLLLLISLAFKIVVFSGMMFSVTAILCSIIGFIIYSMIITCSIKEQRHILNISLIALYLFSIGLYLLLNLPAAESMHHNQVYQIVFEDIPRKFFATTLSYLLSIYLPHMVMSYHPELFQGSLKKALIFSLISGLSFFIVDFYILFFDLKIQDFQKIFFDSFLIAATFSFSVAVFVMVWIIRHPFKHLEKKHKDFSTYDGLYYYLTCIGVTLLLTCLACEYRILTINGSWNITGGAILFPGLLIINTFISEMYGLRANFAMISILVITQLTYDGLLMLATALPSPELYNLNPFYDVILPHRIPIATLSLTSILVSNALLLEYLKKFRYFKNPLIRILTANFMARTILCILSFSLLFSGVYEYRQTLRLALNAWVIKNILELAVVPLLVWSLCLLKKLKAKKTADWGRVNYIDKSMA